MFDKFGEFDSAEEINRAAAAQLKEGDLDAIKTIAEENGLDSEDAEDFCTGAIDSLTTPLLAAIGKLEMESKDLGLKNMMEDWKNFLIQMCEEDDQMAQAVRKKGKSLEKCMAQILKVSFETKTQLDDRIVRAAGLKPPILPTSYAKFKAGKSSTLGGINSRVSNSLKSKCFISRCIRLGYVKAY